MSYKELKQRFGGRDFQNLLILLGVAAVVGIIVMLTTLPNMSALEVLTLFHGLFPFALAAFLVAIGIGVMALFRGGYFTPVGERLILSLSKIGSLGYTLLIVLILVLGTFSVYTSYRAPAPQGADLRAYPRSYLKSAEDFTWLHDFGMEWKEHEGWLALPPAILGTYLWWTQGLALAASRGLMWNTLLLFLASLMNGGIAGYLGALITKIAPVGLGAVAASPPSSESAVPASPPKPIGSVVGLAYGLALLMLGYGAMVFASEANDAFAKAITVMPAVGPLSGKVIYSFVPGLILSAVLTFVMRGREARFNSAMTVFWVAWIVSNILCFPPVWSLFIGH